MPLVIGRDLIQLIQRRQLRGYLKCADFDCPEPVHFIHGGTGLCFGHGQMVYAALEKSEVSEVRFFEPQQSEGESSLM